VSGPERIEWRRSFPSRAISRLTWYIVLGLITVAAAFLLFGDEPAEQSSGAANPLAHVPLWTMLLVALGGVPFLLNVFRRPRVAATHFALTVRPTYIRTLVLPWSRIAEVAFAEAAGERYLLVRIRDDAARIGNSPHWVDKVVLRELSREDWRRAKHFDLAVRMRDFTPAAAGQMGLLAAFAPEHVFIAPL
jgi:hypothetical protein